MNSEQGQCSTSTASASTSRAALSDDCQAGDWDLFQTPTSDDLEPFEETACYELITQLLRLAAYVIAFILVLGTAVTSKLSLLLMVSRIGPDATIVFCNNSNDMVTEAVSVPVPEEEKIYWTWLILIAFAIPEVLTLARSLRFSIFKKQELASLAQFLLPLLSETLCTCGLALFVYVVLPRLDSVTGVMVSAAVCFFPAILMIFSNISVFEIAKFTLLLNIAGALLQVAGFVLWLTISETSAAAKLWLPISLTLISANWWPTYVDRSSRLAVIRCLAEMRPDLLRSGYKSYIVISIWKIIVFFVMMIVTHEINGGNVDNLFRKLGDAFAFKADGASSWLGQPNGVFVWTHPLFLHITTAFLCYWSVKHACKICIHTFSVALPLVLLTMPVTVAVLFRHEHICLLNSPFYGSMAFQVPQDLSEAFHRQCLWIPLLWYFSYIWITAHVWLPRHKRLARVEQIFVTPTYTSFLIDQSLTLNQKRRRLNLNFLSSCGCTGVQNLYDRIYNRDRPTEPPEMRDQNPLLHTTFEDDGANINANEDAVADAEQQGVSVVSVATDNSFKAPPKIPRIKACATMWHENREEMMNLIKSICRMDYDHCARRLAIQRFKIGVFAARFYKFKTHIFFDDAFELLQEKDPHSLMVLNKYVKMLIAVVDEAVCEFYKHKGGLTVQPPSVFSTPYGGRLVWSLPGMTKLVVHLKDNTKIRNRKRWSQCMYMYYLLAYKLGNKPGHTEPDRKVVADNTFLLALDGDVDFHPRSVELLLDLMKRDVRTGAVCGRIHPTGSGPMVWQVWYQTFEYALGHWLQKATEHMSGCVLCSPGCFSLFRSRALMTKGVMGKYKVLFTEPRHYVQYDQGEDRWLCTLLVQEGFRVEYSAAADAFTHAPEDFNTFFTQRRRWIPSTTANILDLLTNCRKTTRANPEVSVFYIAYQMLLFVGTILGPGTILLLLTGASITLFDMGDGSSFTMNLIPIIIFSLVCAYCKNEVQLKVAQVLSVAYALLMVGVLVGIAVRISKEGILAPSSIFLLIITAIFVITAILHPNEFTCLFSGFVYYITIPSMYLLLIIYSVYNVNNVSWGTREDKKKTGGCEEKEEKAEPGGFFRLLHGENDKRGRRVQGRFGFECGNLFNLSCCTGRNENIETDDAATVTRIQEEETPSSPRTAVPDADPLFWTKDPCLASGHGTLAPVAAELSPVETTFWNELISKYLAPLSTDRNETESIKAGLLELRNISIFYFFMANAMFVLLIFLMTLHEKSVSVKWPFGDHDLDLEPIGFVFVLFFVLVLLFQFVVMLFHRFQTFSHILAATSLTNLPKEKYVAEVGIKLVKEVQKMESDGSQSDGAAVTLRHTRKTRPLSEPTVDQSASRQLNQKRNGSASNDPLVENLETHFNRNFDNLSDHQLLKKLKAVTGSAFKVRDSVEFLNAMPAQTRSSRRLVRSTLEDSTFEILGDDDDDDGHYNRGFVNSV